MADGREEREEREKRREWEEKQESEQPLDRDREDQFKPERRES
jgi:hypothetical protein